MPDFPGRYISIHPERLCQVIILPVTNIMINFPNIYVIHAAILDISRTLSSRKIFVFYFSVDKTFNLIFRKTNSIGEATVKKIKPVPGNRFDGKTQAAFLFKKTIKIPIQSKEQ